MSATGNHSNVHHPMTLTKAFQYRDDQLFCEDVPLVRIAQEFGTPCYVYSKNAIRGNLRSFRQAFQAIDPLICYAVKANSNLSILRLLMEEGSGFDVISSGELYRLKKIGAEPDRIIFSGVGKTTSELETALEMSLFSINVESLQELEQLAVLAEDRNLCADISLRINPEVDTETHPYVATGFRQHKFGIDLDHLDRIVHLLKSSDHLRLIGVGFHIGSQILDIEPFMKAFLKLKVVAADLRTHNFQIGHLDLGGGIGIPYQNEERPDLQKYGQFLEQERQDYHIVFEPGRFIVGDTGVLLNQVLYHKVNHDKNFVVVDGAMNDLVRPSLYNAYHEVLSLQRKEEWEEADVVGPVCETGDFFARDRQIPKLSNGEYLALMNAGAYGFVASSNYNSRPRVAEIMVEEDQFQIVRQRESLEDLVRGETG